MGLTRHRVLLVDDHHIVRLGVETLFEGAREFSLCGEARTADLAKEQATLLQPDLIVLDLLLGGRDGIELIGELHVACPDAQIVVYSTLDEMRYARRTLRAGARAYVMKSAPLLKLLEALRVVVAGKPYASESVQHALLDDYICKKTGGDVDGLSAKELHVFHLLGSGLGSAQIATTMGVSRKTVSTYRERIKNKLNLQNARELERDAEKFFREEATG